MLNILKFFRSAKSWACWLLDAIVAENGYFFSKCTVYSPKVGAKSQKLEIYPVNSYYYLYLCHGVGSRLYSKPGSQGVSL